MFNVDHIIQVGGLWLLGSFIFVEVGLFLGFFLPGDTLVIAAGIYAKSGQLSIASVILVSAVAAIAGDSLAYYFGRRLGPAVFTKEDSVIFRPDHIKRAEAFFEKYGSKTLLISHYLPVVRTFTPLLAGVGHMPYRKFLLFDVIGDIAWAISISLVGYYVASKIPNIDNYIIVGLGIVILCSALPSLYHYYRIRKRKRAAKADTKTSDKK